MTASAEPDPKTRASFWLPAFRYLQSQTQQWPTVLEEADVDQAHLESPNAELPLSAGRRLLKAAARRVHTPLFALSAGLSADPETLHWMAPLLNHHDEDGFVDLADTGLDTLSASRTHDHDETVVGLRVGGRPLRDPDVSEYLIGLLHGLSEHDHHEPLAGIEFVHAARGSTAMYRKRLAAPVRFERELCAVLLHAEQ